MSDRLSIAAAAHAFGLPFIAFQPRPDGRPLGVRFGGCAGNRDDAVSVIVCFTIIGIPLGVTGILLWILGLYFAKIVVALLIGRRLFAGQTGQVPHHAALLVAGLVLILIAMNIPYVGGLVNFLLTILGLGLLVSRPIDRYQGRFA